MKLHLGCGQRYLQGYINIDFPSTEHTVQKSSVADQHADILCLQYPAGTIGEVRLHHVFEHFSRPAACALLASWFSWLVTGGKIHIEVPDFYRNALAILNPAASFRSRAVAERHIFGSQEAGWAYHYEGYTPYMLKQFVENYGFKVTKVLKNSWKGTYNFELIAKKDKNNIAREEFEEITERYLKNFLVDESETDLLNIWLEAFKKQLEVSWAK